MVFQKPFGGRFYDGFHAAALRFQRLAQQRLEVGRHAAQQRYGEYIRMLLKYLDKKKFENILVCSPDGSGLFIP